MLPTGAFRSSCNTPRRRTTKKTRNPLPLAKRRNPAKPARHPPRKLPSRNRNNGLAVVYVCTDGQSFKVFSCTDATGACDYQNYKKGQAFQRGEALRVQLAALLPAKCHAQTAAEAQADPDRGEIPPAPSPFKARAGADSNGSGSPSAVNSQAGGGGFKVGDTVRVLSDGWQEGRI